MAGISEDNVVQLWRRLQMMEEMRSEDGSPVKVVYPGRPGDGHGADFRDAVVLLNHRISAGDIEIHTRSSDWDSHGHQRDPAYNGVILHVVMWHDKGELATLQNGRSVPVVALAKRLEGGPAYRAPPLPLVSGLPCRREHPSRVPEDIGGVLDRAGEARFMGKASRFEIEMGDKEAGQVLYEGIMAALGYTRNVAPFRELARRLPLGILEKAAMTGRAASLQRLLLSRAGLAPPALEGSGMNGECQPERSAFRAGQMSPSDWDTSCVRPQNSPARRLMALGHLLRRYRENGIFEGLIAAVRESPLGGGHKQLETALSVAIPGHGGKRVTFLGRERAATIAINVLLPFSYVWGQLSDQVDLWEKAAAIYRAYPKRAANSVEKHMRRQLGLEAGLVNSSRRQQGLLHIYKNLCIRGKCGECPLAGC